MPAAKDALSSSSKDDEWVMLTSDDGFAFMVRRKVAMTSGTLRNMLSAEGEFAEAKELKAPVQERGVVVEKLCEYMAHKSTYEHAGPRDEVPEFTERIPPEIALELLVAADYLEV